MTTLPAGATPSETPPVCPRHPDRVSYVRCQRCEKIICPDCMRDSAVGFQCPDCVKEGARTTRSARTAYGGLRPTNAGITSMVIIGVNVLVWLGALATGGGGSATELPSRFLLDGDTSDASVVLHVLEELYQHLGHIELTADALVGPR